MTIRPLLFLLFAAFTSGAAGKDESKLQLGRLEQISLPVSDIEATSKFYAETLGLNLLLRQSNLIIVDLGGTRLFLGLVPKVTPSTSTLYLRCVDLKLCMEKMKARGVEFAGEPELVARQSTHDLWIVLFKDPDGNSLALMSETPRGFNPAKRAFSR